MKFGASFPADGEALEVMGQGKGLFGDVAELAHVRRARGALREMIGQDPALAELVAVGG